MHRFALLLLLPAALAAQGLGQTAYRLVGTRDEKDPSVRGAGVAVTHGIWSRGGWFGTAAVGAVKASEWSQGAGLDFGYAFTANPAVTPYVAVEWNQTRAAGAWTPGYVVFGGVALNGSGLRRSYRGAENPRSLILEPRYGRLLGAGYYEFDLGYAR